MLAAVVFYLFVGILPSQEVLADDPFVRSFPTAEACDAFAAKSEARREQAPDAQFTCVRVELPGTKVKL